MTICDIAAPRLELARQIGAAERVIDTGGEGWNQQCLVTLRRQTISRILYYDWIYQKLLGKPGIICEFGVYWGATLATLQSLCSTYEPYNHQRKIFGFDTFSGFPSVHEKDGEEHSPGDFSVDAGYKKELEEFLSYNFIPRVGGGIGLTRLISAYSN